MQARGLKPHNGQKPQYWKTVAPHAGAWIETTEILEDVLVF